MIPVSIPYVATNQKKYVNDCLDRNWISAFGKYDDLLCTSFANYVGATYASTCSNGTVALHLALLACNISIEDEVILPNFNGPYALFAIGYVGATPVLIDIDSEWDICLDSLKNAITSKTKALIIPHLYGVPSRVKHLREFCDQHNIYIIEDCAEAHGAREGNNVVGSIGDIACFSFYANKILAAGEGGICLTSDKNLYEKINYFKNQTFNAGPIKSFIHEDIGHNYRMSDLHCAIAFAHFEEIELILDRRDEILQKYKFFLPEFKDCFQSEKKEVSCVNWVTTLQLPYDIADRRDELEEYLLNNGVQSRKFFAPMSVQPIFTKMNGVISESLDNSIAISAAGIYLPTYIGMDDSSIKKICDLIRKFLIK
ncbi:DegT/DnrJ/EryC1/StrS family aminotransferase [Gammaproteobacteria bacterium]|jgi:perosamine synthetase|nr:DegT/DnrJ/EryC1/StrS family aminotransferase [Gammaproteobacteria bacterium]